jgi:hypothetical protein
MKINNVMILNWQAHDDKWWDEQEKHPDEPNRIEARIDFSLSLREYQNLIKQANPDAQFGTVL